MTDPSRLPPGSFVAELASAEEPVLVEIQPIDDGKVSAKIAAASGERTLELEPLRVGPNTWSIATRDRVHEITVVRRAEGLLVCEGPREVEVKLTDRRRWRAGRGAAGGGGQREVKAVMPGKVVTVLVAVGDAVERDQPLLVLEAMKMENDVKSPREGAVKEIRVAPGQAVETGELLVVLE